MRKFMVCAVDGCSDSAWARGWCNLHYKRWRRHGDPTAPVRPRTLPPIGRTGPKTCNSCGDSQPLAEFYSRPRARDGLTASCKTCLAAHDRRRNYGLTNAEYRALEAQQGSACAVCESRDRRLVVDHDHQSGKVRGLLCDPCNMGIGLLGDRAANLKSAVAYLST